MNCQTCYTFEMVDCSAQVGFACVAFTTRYLCFPESSLSYVHPASTGLLLSYTLLMQRPPQSPASQPHYPLSTPPLDPAYPLPYFPAPPCPTRHHQAYE